MSDGGMAEANSSHGPQRRRSPRFGSPPAAPLEGDNKMALGAKRLITVRKIAPRNTQAPPGRDKENTAAPHGSAWSQKVRRSYSRPSWARSPEPDSRQPLFGFEGLRTPEVACSRTALDGSGASSKSLLEAEPDPDIPGVVLVKPRRRRRRPPRLPAEEEDALAARMNAEFREAEDFQLLVE